MTAASVVAYARVADGAHVAYRVSGRGAVDLLDIGAFGTVFSLDATHDQPRWQRFEDGLGRFCRLIRFDVRNIGLSDRSVGPPTVELLAQDALGVLDTLGVKRAVVLGTGFGAPVAIHLAARHPDRVRGLVLANPFARLLAAPDYPIGMPQRVFDLMAARVVPAGEVGDDIDLIAPSVAADPDTRAWWSRESRRGLSPASAAVMWEFFGSIDVRAEVAALADFMNPPGPVDPVDPVAAVDSGRPVGGGASMPTLVLRTTGNRFLLPSFGEWIAQRLPGARLADIDAADHTLWAVPGEEVLGEIEEFLTGVRERSVGRNVVVAILFTDIAGSTSRNAELGNALWGERLARHDHIVRQELRRFGGTLIKTMGDGILATFGAPSPALRCARAISDRAGQLGIPVRTAVHAAEVEERDGDVFGLGVTVAARTLALAEAGEVLTTSTVVALLLGSDLRFAARGEHLLKGVPGVWTLHALQR